MMRFAAFFVLNFFLWNAGIVLAQTEAERHLATLRAAHPGDSSFVEHILANRLEGPQDAMFIANRELLNGLCIKHCGTSEVEIVDTLADGKILKMGLTTSEFDPAAHVFSYLEGTDSIIETIDSLFSFGAVEQMPQTQIDTLWITIDDQAVEIPRLAYQNFYNLNLCYNELFHRAVMLYPSEKQEYFYLYLYGGKSSGTFLAKLVFDRQRYLTQIVSDYSDLSGFDVFRWDFLGF
jgi:hypothetical protein